MKLLGIDYGRRRIGLATSDPQGFLVRGLSTIDRQKHPDTIAPLLAVIAQEKPEAIVFGVPLGPRDEETVMSREIRQFASRLQKRMPHPCPFHFVDESFSSCQAQEQLLGLKKKQRRNKATIDRIAACTILEQYRRETESR